jgi:hypothetical protein
MQTPSLANAATCAPRQPRPSSFHCGSCRSSYRAARRGSVHRANGTAYGHKWPGVGMSYQRASVPCTFDPAVDFLSRASNPAPWVVRQVFAPPWVWTQCSGAESSLSARFRAGALRLGYSRRSASPCRLRTSKRTGSTSSYRGAPGSPCRRSCCFMRRRGRAADPAAARPVRLFMRPGPLAQNRPVRASLGYFCAPRLILVQIGPGMLRGFSPQAMARHDARDPTGGFAM